jgi:hypothetical protein
VNFIISVDGELKSKNRILKRIENIIHVLNGSVRGVAKNTSIRHLPCKKKKLRNIVYLMSPNCQAITLSYVNYPFIEFMYVKLFL